jgi:hypothetical protein
MDITHLANIEVCVASSTTTILPEHAQAEPVVLTIVCYAMAALLGVGLAFYVFPLDFLFPGSLPHAALPEGDMGQHVVGQRYFIADAWRWPLLVVPSLGAPDGTNIGLTDSIPLLALILKAIAAWLPAGFDGIGLWYGIAWTLQPVAAVWCLRTVGERRLLPNLCVALIAVSIPTWWNRFSHAALTAHFLILFALGTYILLVQRGTAWRWLAATMLLCATILVHPYLFLMNSAVIAAAPATLLLRWDRAWRTAMVGFICAMAGSLLLLSMLGYLGTQGEGGFGRYAMNLLSPVWPAGSWLLAPDLARVHAGDVSGWEGYNYLGVGLLLGLPIAFAVSPRTAWRIAYQHSGLMLALVVLTVLALSSRVGFGSSRFVELYRAPTVLELFRSSGRMFWPVTYVFVLTSVLALSRVRGACLRNGLLLAVAALQFVDVTGMRNGLAAQLHAPSRPWKVDATALRPILAAHRSLTVLPRWDCLPTDPSGDEPKAVALDILVLASETTMPVNTMRVAAWNRVKPCDEAASARKPLLPGEMRILLPGWKGELLHLVPDGDRLCRPVGALVVCHDE